MKKYFLISLFAICFFSVKAQDTLYKKTGEKLVVKIVEVNDLQIKYKKIEFPDGPLIVTSKESITKIVYKKGETEAVKVPEIIYNNPNVKPKKLDPRANDYCRNFVSLNTFDLFFKSLSFGYERIFKGGEFSFKIPFSTGLYQLTGDTVDQFMVGYFSYFRKFSTGLEFYYYPGGQGKTKYFIGPAMDYTQFEFLYYDYSVPNFSNKTDVGINVGVFIQQGLIVQPSKHFNVSLHFGVGAERYDYMNNYYYGNDRIRVTVRGGINIGYKF